MTAAKTQQRAGFTLLEVIVIVAILGLLAGIVFPAVVGIMEQQQPRTVEVQLASVSKALDSFRFDIGRLPTAEEGLRALWEQPAEDEPWDRFNWDSPILISPHDPARLYYASQRVWRSDDRGDSWQTISNYLPPIYSVRFG